MIKISLIGDIVCDKEMLKYSDKFDNMFLPLKEYFTDSNYVIGNLESVISNDLKYTDSTFSFCNPESLIVSLKNIGINAFSLANNHILDRDEVGITSTIDALKKHNIEYFGISNDLNIDLNGNKISILGYTDSTNYHINKNIQDSNTDNKINRLKKPHLKRTGPFKFYYKLSPDTRLKIKKLLHRNIKPIVDNEEFDKDSIIDIKNDILKLKKNERYVIIYPHIGGQFNITPGRYTDSVLNELNNSGCDSIIITHPHIIQDVKKYDNCFSIGDLVISPNTNFVIWNKLPNYSMVINYYFDNNKLVNLTLSFLICVKDKDNYLKVYPFYDFYNNLNDKEKDKYLKEFEEVYKRVFNTECSVKKEYKVG